MSRYELLVFLHVSSAIVWLGADFVGNLLVLKASRSGDPAELQRFVENDKWLTPRLYIPFSLATLVFGVLLVLDGPWTFGDLWIVLGLAGYASTFGIGIAFLEPQGRRLEAAMAAEGPASPRVARHAARLTLVSRAQLVLLFAIVAVMASKPATGDTWTLVALGAGVVAAWGATALLARPKAAPEPASALAE